jgi:hypothetical protein
MQKTLATALVAVTAVAALSACEVPETSTAGTGSKDHPVKSKPGMAAPDFTVAQENAIESAQSYLDMSGFSRAGLIHQLTSKAGEGYKMADAEFAVTTSRSTGTRKPQSRLSPTWTCPASAAPG